jgi:hypothetical protein
VNGIGLAVVDLVRRHQADPGRYRQELFVNQPHQRQVQRRLYRLRLPVIQVRPSQEQTELNPLSEFPGTTSLSPRTNHPGEKCLHEGRCLTIIVGGCGDPLLRLVVTTADFRTGGGVVTALSHSASALCLIALPRRSGWAVEE